MVTVEQDLGRRAEAWEVIGSVGWTPPPVPHWQDGPSEWHALMSKLEGGDVSFHDVTTAWFHSLWGHDPCPQCKGTGRLRGRRRNGADPLSALCENCWGRGRKPDAEAQEHWGNLFPALLDVFGRQRGSIVTCYFCEHIRVAAALTDIYTASDGGDAPVDPLPAQWKRIELQHRIDQARLVPKRKERKRAVREAIADDPQRPFTRMERVRAWWRNRFAQKAVNSAIHVEPIFGDPDSPRAKELLFRCLRVHYHAIEWLSPKPRKICTRMTFNVIANLLGTLDDRVGRGHPAAEFDNQHQEQEVLERELLRTEEYFNMSVQRGARLSYLRGTFLGVVGVALLLVPLFAIEHVPDLVALAFMAGALGGVVSVLQRLTSGKLSVNHQDGRWTLPLLGFVRPLLGGVFGMALYALLRGDLLGGFEIQQIANPFFVGAIAFLAGFSERFAKDVLDPAKLVPGLGPRPQAATAPGPAAPAPPP